MLWQGRRESGNVEDRRGMGGPVAVGGGIVGVIILIINFLLGGGDTSQLPTPDNSGAPVTSEQRAAEEQESPFSNTPRPCS